ncbi:MAG: hypothetical protein KBA02_01765 [Paludibacteraceae bacterium]|nr:hypothetical protein [Paludibacteraceae bacterium]HOH96534.1 hypothetical protein [Candidatus Enterocola sp.]
MDINIEWIIVIIILVIAVVYIGIYIYRSFNRKPGCCDNSKTCDGNPNNDACANCPLRK